MVFLVGPPGSGKSALGRRVCTELGLRFVNLVDVGSTDAALQELVRARDADVVTLPWAPARDARWLDLCRRSGETVALWAHPLDMQARSGHAESLFTPVKRLKTRGGFGRSGTACSQHRHLERTCQHVLLLVDLSEEVAAQALKALVEDLRSSEELSPAEREGLLGWCGNWRDDFNADARACEILVDALARFRSTWEAFGTFLRDSAMIDDSSGEP
ncbi:MAG: AAA family ATPase [candidate division NC10 bacterium]